MNFYCLVILEKVCNNIFLMNGKMYDFYLKLDLVLILEFFRYLFNICLFFLYVLILDEVGFTFMFGLSIYGRVLFKFFCIFILLESKRVRGF